MQMNEITVATRQGDIAVIQMGNPNGVPVLALHGWLDNAASFFPLAEYLSDVCLYALDLAGHGKSYHRSFPYNYNIWDDLLDVLDVADFLGLESFRLLGHSRGARIGHLLAATSTRVKALGALDGFLHAVSEGDKAAVNLSDYLAKRMRGKLRKIRYKTLEDMIDTRVNAPLPLTPQAAKLIVERNASAVDGGFVWRTDQALRWRSAVHFTPDQTASFIDAISCPTMLWLASDGVAIMELTPQFTNEKAQVRHKAGGHHFHMETDVETVAAEINAFFNGGQ